jgi:hypothetical protein
MPATLESIIRSAESEWDVWGRSTWNVPKNKVSVGHTDDEPLFARRVIDEYCAVAGGAPSILDIQDDRYFWSAVGISAIMSTAGYFKTEFPFAQSHSVFIRRFIAMRRDRNLSASFWGFRVGEAAGQPEPGDIVAYARGNGMTASRAAALFDRTSPYDSHSDIVVAKRKGEIDVIGCNVLDSVTKKTLRIDAAGNIEDARHFWFAVLKRRDT